MKVFVAEPYEISAVARLKGRCELVDSVHDCEGLLIRSQTKVNSEFLNQAKNLKIVVTATSGFDHIDWKECRKRNIVVAFTPQANVSATAELTMFLIIASLRGTLAQIKNAQVGEWRNQLVRAEGLEGKTLGIVGLGRVGRKVAQLARAFDMQVLAYDPYVDPKIFSSLSIEQFGFVEILRASDVITFHVPLTRETKHMINGPTLRETAHHAHIINASRGAVIDESELLVALREKRIHSVALDVLEKEPPSKSSELLNHPGAIVTPHVGAFTKQAFTKASQAAVDRLFEFIDGNVVSDTLPIEAAWFRNDQ